MIKKFIRFLADKITYPFKKYRLEIIISRYAQKYDDESIDKWYRAVIELCALTKSSVHIYNTSVREKA